MPCDKRSDTAAPSTNETSKGACKRMSGGVKVKVFTAITTIGIGDPTQLAGGISEALITTAAGLSVAIPSLIFYRHLKRKIDELVVGMEQEAMKLVEFLQGDRKNFSAAETVTSS